MALIGSSPHTRGTPPEDRARLKIARFIPAHTGNTSLDSKLLHRLPVHPRTHGEHATFAPLPSALNGSSPHTRGTPRLFYNSRDTKRFIPAHTGNT